MKIVTYRHQRNPEIEIVEFRGELAGSGAMQLADFLYTSLDEGQHYKIIDLKHVNKADGLGLMVLEYFITRGMQIRLFNTGLEIQNLLRLSGKEGVIKTYDSLEQDEAVSLLEKEIIENKCKASGGIKGRHLTRINTSFNTEFKYSSAHNGEILFKATIRNISEGGVYTDQITAFNTKAAKVLNGFEMVGKELCGLKFSLNGGSRLIETDGNCVWETSKQGNKCAGIRFKDMGQGHKEMIRDYVVRNKM
jgi:anti-anti-sigma regulatory factor